ncbi:MAG TPA: short chain dehydrogenase [Bacteriovoracaceae bacterium]|nr:short chain dehydrogenase [Bacteriovoracaceae bacterium]
MKIIIVGGNGTIGTVVRKFLEKDGHIISVGRNSGQYQVDMTDPKSIKALFEKTGKFDALVVAAGDVAFAPLAQLTTDHWETGIRSKFMGQVNLVQIGQEYINDKGSITLTSGILTNAFIAAGTSATSINRAIEGFAQAAATEIGRGIRINVVSPGMLEESAEAYGPFFPGHIPVPSCRVAQSYRRSVMGVETGKIFQVN